MQLDSLGYGPPFSEAFHALDSERLIPARVVAHVGSQLLVAGAPCRRAELTGRLRRELVDAERPTVGDWVALAPGPDLGIVHAILPRKTVLIRRAAGARGERQAVAANVDTFYVVTSANRDANPRRLERYLAAIADSGASAAVVVNKIDLCSPDELAAVIAELAAAARGVPIHAVSAVTRAGTAALAIPSGTTVAFVGMSGVGKSSLINGVLGETRQGVLPIDANDRGRHATARRELVIAPGGGIVIDTPGMRSFGLTEDDGGLATGFADVLEVGATCRFGDCRHQGEPGCAIAAAIDDGTLDPGRVASFDKLAREVEAAERRRDPVLASRSKRRWKQIHVAARARAKHDPKRQD